MSPAQDRRCNGCRAALTYEPDKKTFFAKSGTRRTAKEFCPGCGIRLTLHSTTPVAPQPDDGSGAGGDADIVESRRRAARDDR